jgi:hypothetical protein
VSVHLCTYRSPAYGFAAGLFRLGYFLGVVASNSASIVTSTCVPTFNLAEFPASSRSVFSIRMSRFSVEPFRAFHGNLGPLRFRSVLIRRALPGKLLSSRRRKRSSRRAIPLRTSYTFKKGGVRLSVVNETGKEAVVAVLGAGDFFGEMPGGSVSPHGHGNGDYGYYSAEN